MNIPTDIILLWAGANGDIPANWVRETTLDSKFAKSSGAVAPNNTGGATTHTHTSPAHSHTLGAHTHTYTTSSVDWGINQYKSNNSGNNAAFNGSHNHTGTSGGASGGTITDACTYGAVSNNPPFYSPIFIKAQAGALIETDIIALWAGFGGVVTIPTNWQECTGANGSPDLRNKYLLGASTDADAGATGGSTTNSHDITHSHTPVTHTHTTAASSNNSSVNGKNGGSDDSAIVTPNPHAHNISLDANTQNTNANTDTLVTAETVEPLFKKLCAIQRKATGLTVRGVIGLWLGSVASIPNGWVVCDGNNGTVDMSDYHLKIAASNSEIGNTGGSNTHTHAAQSHSHTSNGSHTHTGSGGNHPGGYQHNSGGDQDVFTQNSNAHTITSDGATASYASANTTADSSNNEPAYRTAAFIQLFNINYPGFFNIL